MGKLRRPTGIYESTINAYFLTCFTAEPSSSALSGPDPSLASSGTIEASSRVGPLPILPLPSLPPALAAAAVAAKDDDDDGAEEVSDNDCTGLLSCPPCPTLPIPTPLPPPAPPPPLPPLPPPPLPTLLLPPRPPVEEGGALAPGASATAAAAAADAGCNTLLGAAGGSGGGGCNGRRGGIVEADATAAARTFSPRSSVDAKKSSQVMSPSLLELSTAAAAAASADRS